MSPWPRGQTRGSRAKKSAHRKLGPYILGKLGDGKAYAKRRLAVYRKRADGTFAEFRKLKGRLEIKRHTKNTVKVVVHTAKGVKTVIASKVEGGYRLSKREALKISRAGMRQPRRWEEWRNSAAGRLKRAKRRLEGK